MVRKPSGFSDGPPRHIGHRKRLRSRFFADQGVSLPDYELLELLLFQALPRRDTKPLAKALLERFGSLSQVIHAPEHLLREVDGVGDSVVLTVRVTREVAKRMGKEKITRRPVLENWQELVEYCRQVAGFATREQLRVVFLDRKRQVIAEEQLQEGTVDHTPVYVRELLTRALELSASGIVLVHNHPSGDTTPSNSDITMTHTIISAAAPLGITVYDHLIVGRFGYSSLRAMGHI